MTLQALWLLVFASSYLQKTQFCGPTSLYLFKYLVKFLFWQKYHPDCALASCFSLRSHPYVHKPHRGIHTQTQTHTQAFYYYYFILQKKVVTSEVYNGSYSKADCYYTVVEEGKFNFSGGRHSCRRRQLPKLDFGQKIWVNWKRSH